MEDGGRGRDRSRSRANGGERESWSNRSESESEEKYIYFGKPGAVEAAAHLTSLISGEKKQKGKGEKAQTQPKIDAMQTQEHTSRSIC